MLLDIIRLSIFLATNKWDVLQKHIYKPVTRENGFRVQIQ